MKFRKIIPVLLSMTALLLLSAGCDQAAQKGVYIIDAEDAIARLNAAGTILVDTQSSTKYKEEHISGAVNIGRANIVVNSPYANMLAPLEQIEEILSLRGITPDTEVIIYDNNKNMDAARLWWTMFVYGHEKIRVVSGGMEALKAAGMSADNARVAVQPSEYKGKPLNKSFIAATGEVKNQIDNPAENVCIVDTRTLDERNEGTIPGSLHINFTNNNFNDDTYKPVRQIRILYNDKGIKFDETPILFCKTSIRAAQSFLALYNAGYESVKVYDAAWLGWSADPDLPIQTPSGHAVEVRAQDGS